MLKKMIFYALVSTSLIGCETYLPLNPEIIGVGSSPSNPDDTSIRLQPNDVENPYINTPNKANARQIFGGSGGINSGSENIYIERASDFTRLRHPGIPLVTDLVLDNGTDRNMNIAVYMALYDSSDQLEHDWIQQVVVPAGKRWHRQLAGAVPQYEGTKTPVVGIAGIDQDGSLFPLDQMLMEQIVITSRGGRPLTNFSN